MLVQSMEPTMVDTYDVAYWRQRSEETRRLAQGMGDAKVRRAMLKLAATYDWIAESAERRSAPAKTSMDDERRSA